MPSTTPTITGEQRDALYELVRNHLSSVGDVWVALEHEDFATVERLGLEFGEDFRLLADLGWEAKDGREAVELTMPPEDLIEMLKRLREDAAGVFSESPHDRESRDEEEESAERYRLVLSTSDGLLAALDARGGIGMTAKGKRLRPGELDSLVLAYMRRNKKDGPVHRERHRQRDRTLLPAN